MKIGTKISFIALMAAFGLVGGVAEAWAQAPAGPSTGSNPYAVQPPAAAAPAPQAINVAAPGSSVKVKTILKDGEKEEKSDIPMEAPKVPDSVKGVVKRLNTATDDVTLDDLNSAREAVVKLDVLIDIEKRLNDLVSLRKEREEKTNASIAAAIPASALGMPGGRSGALPQFPFPQLPNGPSTGMPSSFPTPPVASLPTTPPPPAEPANIDVVRILGASGRYAAQVKESDGKLKMYREGDKVADGSTVESISRGGVTLTNGKKTKLVQVKDISTVFGAK